MVDYLINTSLREKRIITIIYQKDNLITERNIKVTGVRDGMVEAYCYMRHSPRVFKKENILAASFPNNNFSIGG